MEKTFHLDIVSAEADIYSGLSKKLFVTGIMGEMEILAGHAPLLTALAPGPVWVLKDNNEEEAFVILGGILEVQPTTTIILADSAIRAADCDEAAASEAIQNAKSKISAKHSKIDYEKANAELAAAVAQLRIIKKLRNKNN